MKYFTYIKLIIVFIALQLNIQAQLDSEPQDSIEVFVLDSYIPVESPNLFFLSFITSEQAKTVLVINGKYSIDISKQFAENHKAEINLSRFQLQTKFISCVIIAESTEGRKNLSEPFEVDIPIERTFESSSNVLTTCLLGSIIFLVPSPQVIVSNGKSYLGLTKEIPLAAKFSGGYNYPIGYFAAEYSHVFETSPKNLFRLGYKHIFEIPVIEYISVGINGFTNFNGDNGISPEVSLGLFQVSNVFTIYSRYRYSFIPSNSGYRFSDVSIGIFSSFFTFNF